MENFETGCYIDNADGTWSNKGLFGRFLTLCRTLKVDRSNLPYPTEADTINSHPDVDEVFNKFIGALNNDSRTQDGRCWAWHENAFGLWNTSEIYDEELA